MKLLIDSDVCTKSDAWSTLDGRRCLDVQGFGSRGLDTRLLMLVFEVDAMFPVDVKCPEIDARSNDASCSQAEWSGSMSVASVPNMSLSL